MIETPRDGVASCEQCRQKDVRQKDVRQKDVRQKDVRQKDVRFGIAAALFFIGPLAS